MISADYRSLTETERSGVIADVDGGEEPPFAAHVLDLTELIRRSQRGDRAAFRQLRDHYQPNVFRYFLIHRGGDAESAGQLASTTFAHALHRLSAYESRHVSFAGWLYRLAQEVLLGHRQIKGHRGSPSPAAQANPDDRLWLVPPLATLPQEQRSVLILRGISHLSTSETAYALRVSEVTVNRVERQARQALDRWRRALDGALGL